MPRAGPGQSLSGARLTEDADDAGDAGDTDAAEDAEAPRMPRRRRRGRCGAGRAVADVGMRVAAIAHQYGRYTKL